MNILKSIFKPIMTAGFRQANKGTLSVVKMYNFDGADDRFTSLQKLIDVDQNIDISFKTGSNSLEKGRVIISQCNSTDYTKKEFILQVNNSNANLQIAIGGTYLNSMTGYPIKPNTKYRVTLEGDVLRYYEDDVLAVTHNNVVRGTNREEYSFTVVGCLSHGQSYVSYCSGSIYDLNINGTLFKFDQTYFNAQLPDSNVLGAETVDLTKIEPENVEDFLVKDGRIQYTAIDTWGQRPFIVPINLKANTLYLVDVEIEGLESSDSLRLILNDKKGRGAPSVIPQRLNGPFSYDYLKAGNTVAFNTSSDYYGSFSNMTPASKGRYRTVFFTPNTAIQWYGSLKRDLSQNGLKIQINKFSIKPIWTANQDLMPDPNFQNGVSGWVSEESSISVTDNVFKLTTLANKPSKATYALTNLVIGKIYCLTGTLKSLTSVPRAQLRTIRGADGNYGQVSSSILTSPGNFITTFKAQSNEIRIRVDCDNVTAGSAEFSRISLIEITDVCPLIIGQSLNPQNWIYEITSGDELWKDYI